MLCPEARYSTKEIKYEMVSVGIDDVLVFPGFCQKHEELFLFEKECKISENRDYKLQIFRTLCEEIVFYEHKIEELEISLSNYNDKYAKKFEEKVKTKIKNVELREIKIDNKYSKILKLNIKKLQVIEKKLNNLLILYENDSISISVLKIPFQIPVAIAGICSFGFGKKEEDKIENRLTIVNCIPFENEHY